MQPSTLHELLKLESASVLLPRHMLGLALAPALLAHGSNCLMCNVSFESV